MITVLLPTYNDERYIRQTVQSILNSSYTNFELLIINDGSTDKTLEIVGSFQDARIRILSQPNRGLIFTLNRGLKEAKFDIIARIDGDDIMHPRRLERQIAILLSGKADIVGSNAMLINSENAVLGEVKLPEYHDSIEKCLRFIKPSIIHPAVMFRKESVILSGGYNALYLHAEDYELWTRLIKDLTFYNIQDNLISLRKHTLNISHTAYKTQMLNTFVARTKYICENLDEVECQLIFLEDPILNRMVTVNASLSDKFTVSNYFKKAYLIFLKHLALLRIHFCVYYG